MSKFLWYGIGAAVVIVISAAVGYVFLSRQPEATSPILPQLSERDTSIPILETQPTAPMTIPEITAPLPTATPPTSSPTLTPPPATPPPTSPSPTPPPQPKKYIIYIDATGFTPQIISIVSGDSVTWINRDSALHWPASDPHPTHTRYSEFDALGDLAQQERYTFTFKAPGVYGYHDHTEALAESEEIFTGAVKVFAP